MTTLVPAPPVPAGPVLVLLVGPPGVGKTTFCRRFPPGAVWSLDQFREAVADDAADQSATPWAIAILTAIVDGRLSRRLTTVVDATNVDPAWRASLITIARRTEVPVVAVVFDRIPLRIALARNAARARVVPEEVVRVLHRQMVAGLPGLAAEVDAVLHAPALGWIPRMRAGA